MTSFAHSLNYLHAVTCSWTCTLTHSALCQLVFIKWLLYFLLIIVSSLFCCGMTGLFIIYFCCAVTVYFEVGSLVSLDGLEPPL